MNWLIRIGLAITVAVATGLSGCAPMLMGAVATTGVVLAQDRSVGNAIDDFTIQTDLRQRLYSASQTDFNGIELEVVESRVLMTGRVDDQERRIEATRIAWTTPGVEDVINEAEITDQRNNLIRPRDAWISTQLRARLLGDGSIRQVNYHIDTLNGTVYLFGIAQDEAELDRATEHARTIRGVERVVSHMRLKDERLQPPARGI